MIIYERIEVGDVILTKGSWSKSWPIKLGNILRGRCNAVAWTYVAIALGGRKIFEAIQTGLHIGDLDSDYHQKGARFIVLRCKELDPSQGRSIADYCLKQSGKSYDHRALTYFVLNSLFPFLLGPLLTTSCIERFLNVEDSYFCSELVAEGFGTVGIKIIGALPAQTMPVDFLNLKRFDLVLDSLKN